MPIDGEIVEGQTTIDESMLTGEPLAVARREGDPVTGGTMNRSGAFILKVTRLGEDTTLARIIRMVKTAQMSKPPIGRLVDRIAGVFVPVVISISLITFFAWWALAVDLPPGPRIDRSHCGAGHCLPLCPWPGDSDSNHGRGPAGQPSAMCLFVTAMPCRPPLP